VPENRVIENSLQRSPHPPARFTEKDR